MEHGIKDPFQIAGGQQEMDRQAAQRPPLHRADGVGCKGREQQHIVWMRIDLLILLGKYCLTIQQEEQLKTAQHRCGWLSDPIPGSLADAAHCEHCLVEQTAVGIGPV